MLYLVPFGEKEIPVKGKQNYIGRSDTQNPSPVFGKDYLFVTEQIQCSHL
jgi:hypothetical protein